MFSCRKCRKSFSFPSLHLVDFSFINYLFFTSLRFSDIILFSRSIPLSLCHYFFVLFLLCRCLFAFSRPHQHRSASDCCHHGNNEQWCAVSWWRRDVEENRQWEVRIGGVKEEKLTASSFDWQASSSIWDELTERDVVTMVTKNRAVRAVNQQGSARRLTCTDKLHQHCKDTLSRTNLQNAVGVFVTELA